MTYREAMEMAAKDYLEKLLTDSPSVSAAARTAGVRRSNFYKLCKRHNVVITVGRNLEWMKDGHGSL